MTPHTHPSYMTPYTHPSSYIHFRIQNIDYLHKIIVHPMSSMILSSARVTLFLVGGFIYKLSFPVCHAHDSYDSHCFMSYNYRLEFPVFHSHDSSDSYGFLVLHGGGLFMFVTIFKSFFCCYVR